MYDFYNGLAEIMERNMNNPDSCVMQARNHIKAQGARMKRVIDTARQLAQSRPQAQMSEAELQAKMQQTQVIMAKDKGVQAAQRFMQSFQAFTMKYPDHAEKIVEAFEELGLILGGH